MDFSSMVDRRLLRELLTLHFPAVKTAITPGSGFDRPRASGGETLLFVDLYHVVTTNIYKPEFFIESFYPLDFAET